MLVHVQWLQLVLMSNIELQFFRYSILLSCWFNKSSERPNFSALVEYLNRVIEHEPHPDHGDDRLQQNQDTQEFNRPYFVLEATN